jgi:large subunit ribosomal protein L24
MRLKKDDEVIVITGKDKGKKGKVLKIFPKKDCLVVEKINYKTVYLRKSQQNPKGGISKVEAPMSASKVMLVCPRTGKPTRVGYSFLADGTKQRISKKSGEVL